MSLQTAGFSPFIWLNSISLYTSGASGKESAYNTGDIMRRGFDPWVGKVPWRRKWQPTPVFSPGEWHGQKSLQSMGFQESDHKWSDWACTHTWFCWALQIVCFSQIEGLWQPCTELVYRHHFYQQHLLISFLCHILVIFEIFPTFHYFIKEYFISLLFTLLCLTNAALFTKMKVCGNPTLSDDDLNFFLRINYF